jgi:hypothetical protein
MCSGKMSIRTRDARVGCQHMNNRPDLLARLVPTAASARLWRAVLTIFLGIALLWGTGTLRTVGTDLQARRSWPQAAGELTSISEESSAGVDRASRRTRYWVQYVVHFAVPPGQCRTGVTDGNEGGVTVCVGTVRTRSTQSTYTAGRWMRESFPKRSVQVLYDPAGPGIKLADEPVWLRYQWDSRSVLAVWLLASACGLVVVRRRLRVLEESAQFPGVVEPR